MGIDAETPISEAHRLACKASGELSIMLAVKKVSPSLLQECVLHLRDSIGQIEGLLIRIEEARKPKPEPKSKPKAKAKKGTSK